MCPAIFIDVFETEKAVSDPVCMCDLDQRYLDQQDLDVGTHIIDGITKVIQFLCHFGPSNCFREPLGAS